MSESPSAKTCQQVANGEKNPFWTLEAAQEHLGMLWYWYHKEGYEIPEDENGKRIDNKEVGDFSHEMLVVERYLKDVFNTMAAIQPLLYAASDGDNTALLMIKDHLIALSEKHQEDWDDIQERRNAWRK